MADSVEGDSDHQTTTTAVISSTLTAAAATLSSTSTATANASSSKRLTTMLRYRAANTACGCFSSAALHGDRKGLMKMVRIHAAHTDHA